jgi:hypothetical protein
MREIMQSQGTPENQTPPFVTIVIGAVTLIAISASLWFVLKSPEPQSIPTAQAAIHAQMNPAEQAYLKTIRIENIALSRAENFLHQEVTILNADAVNSGSQTVQALAVTVEFSDDMHQVVLRETRGVLGTPPTVIPPGQTRNFEISFDRVPSRWNMQQPAVQVSYLQLAIVK